MNKFFYSLIALFLSFPLIGQTEPFVMTIRLVDSIEGQTNSTSFEIPIYDLPQYNYDYAVDWNYNGNFQPDASNINGSITHNYGQHGVFTVAILAETFDGLPSIRFYNSDEGKKVVNVNQWGDNLWRTMSGAFNGCKYLDISATDIPDFSQVIVFSSCFSNCELLKGNSTFNQWDVSRGTSFRDMFYNAKLFNQDIGNWDMSSAGDFEGMFQGASSFNQDIGNWDVSSVNSFGYAFYEASSFNQDIGSWDVSNSVSFFRTFFRASSFNQDLGDWNVGSSRTFNGMFWHATSFNQDIANWNVGLGESFANMFSRASSFNQNIGDWNVSSGEDFAGMFNKANSFNQDISGWDVSTSFQFVGMFENAISFDHSLGSWDMASATNISSMLDSCGISVENYDSTLIGWASQNVQQDVRFGAENLEYCNGESARNTLILKGWTIVGDRKDCTIDPFVMTIKLVDTIQGQFNSTSFRIPVHPHPDFDTYEYSVDWDFNGVFEPDDVSINGSIWHDYMEHGTYQVAIVPETTDGFPAIYFNFDDSTNKDALKLISIDQWGDNKWKSLGSAFRGCRNLDLLATDIPVFEPLIPERMILGGCFAGCESLIGNSSITQWDVSSVSSFGGLFEGAELFNQDIGNWDVSAGQSFGSMFKGAISFNQDLSNWDVSNANLFASMFENAVSFNQEIGEWDVSNGSVFYAMFSNAKSFNNDINNWDMSSSRNLAYMFKGASKFNQDISNWKVSLVNFFNGMFMNTDSFNQDIGNWNVSSGEEFTSMFSNAQSFDHNLGKWEIISANKFDHFLDSSGMSIESYDSTLIGWNQKNVNSDIILGAENLKYCLGENARFDLISKGWSIVGDQKDCTDIIGLVANLAVLDNKANYCRDDVITLDAVSSQSAECDTGGIESYSFYYSDDNVNWIPISNPPDQAEATIALDSTGSSSTVYFRCMISDNCDGESYMDEAFKVINIESFNDQLEFACGRGNPGQENNLLALYGLASGTFESNQWITVENDGMFTLKEDALGEQFYISYESENGCVYDNRFQLSVIDVPAPELSFLDTTICQGDQLTIELFNAQLYSGAITWTFNGTQIGNNVNQVSLEEHAPDTNILYTGYVNLIYEDDLNCEIKDTFSLQVAPTFNYQIEAIDTCKESIFQIDPLIPNAEYMWLTNDPALSILGPINGPMVRTEGNGILVATVDNGCEVSKGTNVNTQNTTVIPVDNSSPREIHQRACNGSVLMVFAEEHCGLRWGYDDHSSGSTVFPLKVNGRIYRVAYLNIPEEDYENRTYFIEATLCGSECETEIVVLRSSLRDLDVCEKNKYGLVLYPNPTQDATHLKLLNWEKGSYELEIFNSIGKMVKREVILVDDSSSFIHQVLLTEYLSGFYNIRIVWDGELMASKSLIIVN